MGLRYRWMEDLKLLSLALNPDFAKGEGLN